MNPSKLEGEPRSKTGGLTRRATLATGAGLGVVAALGFKPQEAQAAVSPAVLTTPSAEVSPAVTELTIALSEKVTQLSLKLEQAGISGGPGSLYANAWGDRTNATNEVGGLNRIPYEGVIFREDSLVPLAPDQTLMQIARQPGFNEGLSQGSINGQPVDTIPLPQDGRVEVDPTILTVVQNLGNLFRARYRVTAAQAYGPFNVFRVAAEIAGVWEDSFALRQDLEGSNAGSVSFAKIAKAAELANIIPQHALFEPGEAGTGGPQPASEAEAQVATILEQTKAVNTVTVRRNGVEYKVETRQASNTPSKIILQESLAQETADLIAESAELHKFKNLYAVTLPSKETFPADIEVFTATRFINGKQVPIYRFGSQRIGDNVLYYFELVGNVANISEWSITGDILSTAVGNGNYNVGSRATNNVEKYNDIIRKTPFKIAT